MSTVNNNSVKSSGSAYAIWLGIFAVLTVAGLIAWYIQLTRGLILTDLGDHKVWGLYIVGFMFFTGIAAGSLIAAALPHAANLSQYKPYTKIASFVAAVSSVIAAGLFILVDIGNPERLWNMIVHANLSSPLVWDSIILLAYAFLSIYFLSRLIMLEADPGQEKSVKGWSYVVLIAGLLVGVTANVFGLQISKPSWYTALQPFSFLVTAIIVGLAFLILISILLRAVKYISIEEELLSKMGKVTGLLIILNLCMTISELVTEYYPGTTEGLSHVQYLLTGGGAPLFWTQVLIGGVLALVLLFIAKGNIKVLGVGAFLALVGVFLQKFNLLMGAFFLPLINYAGPALHGDMGYFPSLVEFGVAIGIISLGALFLMIGIKRLPLSGGQVS